jgi:uncharacterized protein (TIGR02453 family)
MRASSTKKQRSQTSVRFSTQTLAFIEKAARQKNPNWLGKNRSEYEAALLLPLQALASHLKAALAPRATGYHFPLKGIGRLKRSSRSMSESGAIYKNWVSYSASRPSKSRFERNPSLYFGLHPGDEDGDQVLVAGGLYMPSSPQLRAVREAVAADASAFDRLFATKAFSARFKGGFSDERISTRSPRGFDPAHPRMDWLRLQAFFVWKSYSKRDFTSSRFAEEVAADWEQILKLNELLDLAVQGRLARSTPVKASRKKEAPLISRLEELDVVARRPDFD